MEPITMDLSSKTPLPAYWDDLAVAERALADGRRYAAKTATAAAGGAGAPVGPAEPSPTNRAAALYKWDDHPLVAAAASGDVEWVNELLAAGADVNELSHSYEYMPLIAAAQLGHVEVVRTLLMTAACDLTKKHMDGYISALESALNGYNNFDGFEDEFTPEIRAMIIRAHVETADRIDLDTLLAIEASAAVTPDQIKAFRSGLGARVARIYPKASAGHVNLSDPPASKVAAIISAAEAARRRLAVSNTEPISRKQRNAHSGGAIFSASYNTTVRAPTEEYISFASEERGEMTHAMRRQMERERRAREAELDDKYGKMARSFNFRY